MEETQVQSTNMPRPLVSLIQVACNILLKILRDHAKPLTFAEIAHGLLQLKVIQALMDVPLLTIRSTMYPAITAFLELTR